MRRLLLLLILPALALPAAAACLRPRRSITFEAPRELLSASTRDATLDQITAFGVTHVRQLVYWRDYRARAGHKTKPAFDASDPNAYPADKWDNLDGLIAAAAARGVAGHADADRPGAQVGDQEQADNVTDPIPTEFGAFATAIGRRYGDRGEHVVDLERAQPAAVPQAAVQRAASRRRRSSTASSTRPPTRACARRRPTPRTRS